MKKSIAALAVSLLLCGNGAKAADNFSAYSKLILENYKTAAKTDMTLSSKYIGALIKVDSNIDEKALINGGVKVGAKAGDIWSLKIPIGFAEILSNTKGVVYVDLDRFASPNLYNAKKTTGVDKAQAGTNLKMPFTGKNVVVGIVDAGFEYTHPVFRDAVTKETRIKRVWEQKSNGVPPNGFSYGTELRTPAEMQFSHSDVDTFSHGSHVAGIVAGIAVAGDSLYSGVAPAADIVLVGIKPEENEWISGGMSSLVDAFAYIFRYADSVKKPAVINLSWGGNLGAHDGKSLFNQACNNLTGPGKVIAMSAGNSGDVRMHFAYTFKGKDSIFKTFVTVPTVGGINHTWVDMWAENDKAPQFMFELNKTGKEITASTDTLNLKTGLVKTYTLVGSDNESCVIEMAINPKEANGKAHAFFNIKKKTTDRLVMTCKGSEGSLNMWNDIIQNYNGYEGTFSNGGVGWAKAGDFNWTASDLAMADSVICVAAYTSNAKWSNLDGKLIDYSSAFTSGDIAYFSSLGPGGGSRNKPDIAAPGAFILSAVNSTDSVHYNKTTEKTFLSRKITDDGKDYYFAYAAGTSMSSPMTTGIIALMLEANPKLGPGEVLNILKASSIQDKYYTKESTWGMGKIDAYRALSYMEGKLDVSDNANTIENNSFGVYPNPNSGVFKLDFKSLAAGEYDFRVYNSIGETVFTASLANTGAFIELEMPNLAHGTYFGILSNGAISKFANIEIK